MEEDLEMYEPFDKNQISAVAASKRNKMTNRLSEVGERARLYSSSEVIKEEFPNNE